MRQRLMTACFCIRLCWFFPIIFSVFALSNPIQANERIVVKDIKISGLQRVSLGTVLTRLNVSVGDELSEKDAAQIIKSLYQIGYFDQIQVSYIGQVLHIEVLERPTITKIEFSGNEDIKSEVLTEALSAQNFIEGEIFDPKLLSTIERELVQQYHAFGKYGVALETTIRTLPRNRVEVAFEIDEGEAATIERIEIVGNTLFDDETLLEELQLTTGGLFSFFTSDNQYSKEKLIADRETLIRFYRDHGYVRFAVDDVQVALSPARDAVHVTFEVTEGEQYTISSVEIAGDWYEEQMAAGETQSAIPIDNKAVYRESLITATEGWLGNEMGKSGYAFASVKTLRDIDDASKTVALTFWTNPGQKTYVRDIHITGNLATDENVFRRELRVFEGGLLQTDALKRSRSRIQRLSYVESVDLQTEPVAGTNNQADVFVDIKERSSGQISGGVGYSSSQNLILNASVSQDNFLGTGKKVAANVNFSRSVQLYDFTYTDPYYTEFGVSRTMRVFYRRTDFDKINRTDETLDAIGANIFYGFPLSEYDRIRFGAGYQRSDLTAGLRVAPSEQMKDFYESFGQNIFLVPELGFDVFTFNASWQRNTLNRGVFPTRGTRHNFSTEFSLPFGELKYYKFNYRIEHYLPLIKEDVVLRLTGNLSYGDGYGDDENGDRNILPIFENFTGGGQGTLRGFDNNSVGPLEIIRSTDFLGAPPGGSPIPLPPEFDRITVRDRTVGGNARYVASAELIFPLPFVEKKHGLRTSVFVDAGNVFDTNFDRNDFDDLIRQEEFDKIPDFSDPFSVRVSAGFSVQWLSPIAPMTVSVGFPLLSEENDETEVFQFNIGRTF